MLIYTPIILRAILLSLEAYYIINNNNINIIAYSNKFKQSLIHNIRMRRLIEFNVQAKYLYICPT